MNEQILSVEKACEALMKIHKQGFCKIVIYPGVNGSVRFQELDGQPVEWKDLHAVQPELKQDDRPESLKEAEAEMGAARIALEKSKELTFSIRDEIRTLHRRRASHAKIAEAEERVQMAKVEFEETRKAFQKASAAYNEANERWSREKQWRQLQESKKMLEAAKGAELEGRRRILFGWKTKQGKDNGK